MNRLKRLPYGAIVGLIFGILTMFTLNAVFPGGGVVVAQEGPTPTPVVTQEPPTPTVTLVPTAVPSLQLKTFVQLSPEGDLNGDGVINPGDTVIYTVSLTNAGETPSGPVEVVAFFDATFISGVANISDGGIAAEEGQVIWSLEDLAPGDERSLGFSATLKGRFPPGRTQVTGSVAVRTGVVELARSTLPSLDVVGPNLRLVDVAFELITDTSENGRIDPGDTVRFTLSYINDGGGPSQEASIIADYPDELTRGVVTTRITPRTSRGRLPGRSARSWRIRTSSVRFNSRWFWLTNFRRV